MAGRRRGRLRPRAQVHGDPVPVSVGQPPRRLAVQQRWPRRRARSRLLTVQARSERAADSRPAQRRSGLVDRGPGLRRRRRPPDGCVRVRPPGAAERIPVLTPGRVRGSRRRRRGVRHHVRDRERRTGGTGGVRVSPLPTAHRHTPGRVGDLVPGAASPVARRSLDPNRRGRGDRRAPRSDRRADLGRCVRWARAAAPVPGDSRRAVDLGALRRGISGGPGVRAARPGVHLRRADDRPDQRARPRRRCSPVGACGERWSARFRIGCGAA